MHTAAFLKSQIADFEDRIRRLEASEEVSLNVALGDGRHLASELIGHYQDVVRSLTAALAAAEKT